MVVCGRPGYICTVQHECPAFNTDLGGKQRNGKHVSEAHLVWTRIGQEVSSSSDVQASSTAGLGWRSRGAAAAPKAQYMLTCQSHYSV